VINSIHCSVVFYSEQNDNGTTKIFGTNKENVHPNFVAQNGPQNVFQFQAGANGNVNTKKGNASKHSK